MTVQGETSTVANGSKASAHVDFVVIIPETLSLEIADSSRLTENLQPGLVFTEQSGTVQQLASASVSAMGTLSAGGAMALTIQDSIPVSDQNRRQVTVSAITWTSGGVDSSGGLKDGASVVNSSSRSDKNTHSYKGIHPHSSNRGGKTTSYTLSSP